MVVEDCSEVSEIDDYAVLIVRKNGWSYPHKVLCGLVEWSIFVGLMERLLYQRDSFAIRSRTDDM